MASTVVLDATRRSTVTIASLVRDRAAEEGSTVAMREKVAGIWRDITWEDYWSESRDVAHGLMALGVEPGDRVAVHSENRKEWLFSDVAIVAVRAITVGLYPTNPPPEVLHQLQDCGAKVLIAEDQEQVDKALEVSGDLPNLEKIIYMEPRGVRAYTDPRLMSWTDLVELGRRHAAEFSEAVAERMGAATADDVVTLIYTSGSTGRPKGVMLSARNVEFAIQKMIREGGLVDPPGTPQDSALSYLPLSHVSERLFSSWFGVATGARVHFAESFETVQQNLVEVQPTVVVGVPRIWEKIHASVEIRMNSASWLKRANYRIWLAAAERIGAVLEQRHGRHSAASRALYLAGSLFLYSPLKRRLGLAKCRYAASAAAPIAPQILRFFMAIGVPILEAYGMSENAAVGTRNTTGNVHLGTVGFPYPGTDVRVDEQTGEILTRSDATFVGYWGRPEATAEVVDDDGWLHTGDVGEWTDAGALRITGRMKDIIITSGGKNIAPGEIENALKVSPYIKEAVVIGDRRNFLTALIAIEGDTVGDWAQREGIVYTTYRDLTEKPQVRELMQRTVDEVNKEFARVAGVKKFRLIPKELDHEDGELTATQKIKRSAIEAQFSDLINSMYGSPA